MKRIFMTAVLSILLLSPLISKIENSEIQTLLTDGSYKPVDTVVPMDINTLSDVISKRPTLPTVDDILSPETKATYANKNVLAYERGVQRFRMQWQNEQTTLQNKQKKIGNMADSSESIYTDLQKKLHNLAEETMQLKEKYMNLTEHENLYKRIVTATHNFMPPALPTNQLEKLFLTIFGDWRKSAEYNKVSQIEKNLVWRIENWDFWSDAEDGQTIYYPVWWTAGRKQENEQIELWNRRNAERWLATVQQYDDQIRNIAQELLALDNQLEQVRAGKKFTPVYIMAKMQVYEIEVYLTDYYYACSTALHFPCVNYQAETDSFVFYFKGY